jgi:topoisomerase-4 subunit A
MDDVVVVRKDGVMKVMKIADKMFVGKSPLRVAIFRRGEKTTYNMVYRDGASGRLYAKKFQVGGVTRDKEYNLFKPHSRSRVFFFAVHKTPDSNSNVLVHLDPTLKRIKEMTIDFDFSWLDLQGRSVKGTTLTAHKVDRVVNSPKTDSSEDAHPPPPKTANKKSTPPAKEEPLKKTVKAKRGTKPADASPANRLPDAKDAAKSKRRGRPNKPEPDGQATLDI